MKNETNSTYHDLPWTIIQGMDRKKILNYQPDKYLFPVCKIFLYATLPPSGLYRIQINHMSTQEIGLD